jgi:uncharacterized protein with GYD domain
MGQHCPQPIEEKETTMALYLFQGAYTSEAWAAQIRNPQNRVALVQPVIEGQGGKLLSVYYAFGEYDLVAIVEFPDNVSASAVTLAIAGGGAFKAQKTTVLLSIEEGLEAMRRASGTGYRPPGS